MSARGSWSSLFFLSLLAVACEREPAIVIRFDLVDLSGRDLQRSRDLAAPNDAASAPDAATAPAARVAPVPASARCHADADCVLVPDGCCGCANGGKQVPALAREQKKLVAAQHAQCKDVMCTMMVSNDPTCGKRVGCIEGSCVMREARPSEQPRKLRPTPSPQ